MVVPAPTFDAQKRSETNVVRAAETPVMEPLPLTPLEQFLLQCAGPQSPMVIRVVLRLTGDCPAGPVCADAAARDCATSAAQLPNSEDQSTVVLDVWHTGTGCHQSPIRVHF